MPNWALGDIIISATPEQLQEFYDKHVRNIKVMHHSQGTFVGEETPPNEMPFELIGWIEGEEGTNIGARGSMSKPNKLKENLYHMDIEGAWSCRRYADSFATHFVFKFIVLH